VFSSSEVSEASETESIEDDTTDSIFSSYINSLATTPNETPQNETNFQLWVNQPLENNDISTPPPQNLDFDFGLAPIEQENDALFFGPQHALHDDDNNNDGGGFQNNQDQNHEFQFNETPPHIVEQILPLQPDDNLAQTNPQELQPNNNIQLQFDDGGAHTLQFDQTDNEHNSQHDAQLQFDQIDESQTNQIVIQMNGPPLNNQDAAQLNHTQQNQLDQLNQNHVEHIQQQQQYESRSQRNEVNDRLQRQIPLSLQVLPNQNQVIRQSRLNELVFQEYLGGERESIQQQRQQLQDDNVQSRTSRMLQIQSNVAIVNNDLDQFEGGKSDQNGRRCRLRGISDQFMDGTITTEKSHNCYSQTGKQKKLAGENQNVGPQLFNSFQDISGLLDPKILSKITSLTQAIEIFDGKNQVFQNLRLPSQYSLFQYVFSNLSQIFNLFPSFIVGVVSNRLIVVQ